MFGEPPRLSPPLAPKPGKPAQVREGQKKNQKIEVIADPLHDHPWWADGNQKKANRQDCRAHWLEDAEIGKRKQ
jgi:hypothetical protein